MGPGRYNLAVYRGDAFTQPFRFYSTDGVTKTYVDLAGLSGGSQIRESREADGVLLATFVVAITAHTTDATGVQTVVTVSLADTVTAGLPDAACYWDLAVGGRTWLAGRVVVTGDVTR